MSSPSTTRSILKCPSCNYEHHLSTKHYGDHSVRFNIAREIFGVTAQCPVCLDECSGFMALPCGHILCKDDYQRMGGVMPTPSDSNRYKIVCEVDLRRSDASVTRPPLELTFREPATVARSSVPTRTATHSTSTSTFNFTNAVAEHSSTSSHIESGWEAFETGMRIMESSMRSSFPTRTATHSTSTSTFNFTNAPVAEHSLTSSHIGSESGWAAFEAGMRSMEASMRSMEASLSGASLQRSLVSAGSSGATNHPVFVFAPTSAPTAAGLTGTTNVQFSFGDANGASVATSHRSTASANAPSSTITAVPMHHR